MNYWFFLSYARADNKEEREDRWGKRKPFVNIFYEDLCLEIANKRYVPESQKAGFFDDTEIGLGMEWPDTLVSGLQQSQVFVSIYSPTYFNKEFCGKEWAIFSSRVENYAQSLSPGSAVPELMLPVFWEAETHVNNSIPDVLNKIQFKTFGYKDHAQYGLRQMMRNNQLYENVYPGFVRALAEWVIAVAEKHSLPALKDPPEIEAVTPTFPVSAKQPAKPASNQPANSKPGSVKFIFVAGSKDELESLKPPETSLVRYGEKGVEWRPWHPENKKYAYDIVLDTISGLKALKLWPEGSIPPDEQLIKKLEEVQKENRIAIIVVDMWTLKLPNYYKLMRELDERMLHEDKSKQLYNCVTLVLRNTKDEDDSVKGDLEEALEEAFEKSTQLDPKNFLSKIESDDDLKIQLGEVLLNAKEKILKRAEVLRKAEGGKSVDLSHLKGPGRR